MIPAAMIHKSNRRKLIVSVAFFSGRRKSARIAVFVRTPRSAGSGSTLAAHHDGRRLALRELAHEVALLAGGKEQVLRVVERDEHRRRARVVADSVGPADDMKRQTVETERLAELEPADLSATMPPRSLEPSTFRDHRAPTPFGTTPMMLRSRTDGLVTVKGKMRTGLAARTPGSRATAAAIPGPLSSGVVELNAPNESSSRPATGRHGTTRPRFASP